MNTAQMSPILPTVSRLLLEDWLIALRRHCEPRHLDHVLTETGLSGPVQPQARVTHDQIVRLYQLVAIETGDEMMGLWSRPIRSGALKNLCTYVRGASSLSAALFRFTAFWNLLLDDFELSLTTVDERLRIDLHPRGEADAQRFGHMLLLKLTHGIASWLVGRELPVITVDFTFERPDFAEDYPILFPGPIRFGASSSGIAFAADIGPLPVSRTKAEMQAFLVRAPRDWIFTSYREHALPLRVRELILTHRMELHLNDAAAAFNLTPRTLIRRLAAEGVSFQSIKDGLRRDMAIRDLMLGTKSVEAIAQDTGFASAATFHRAFKRWTGVTPGRYRRG